MGILGKPDLLKYETLPGLLENALLILPTESVIRAEFESLIVHLGVRPNIVANVDDMAIVRLLVREGVCLAVAPTVVLAEEIASGSIATAPIERGFAEPFFTVTLPRRFPHPALSGLLIAE